MLLERTKRTTTTILFGFEIHSALFLKQFDKSEITSDVKS